MNRYFNTIRRISAMHDEMDAGQFDGLRSELHAIDASSFAGAQGEMVTRMKEQYRLDPGWLIDTHSAMVAIHRSMLDTLKFEKVVDSWFRVWSYDCTRSNQ